VKEEEAEDETRNPGEVCGTVIDCVAFQTEGRKGDAVPELTSHNNHHSLEFLPNDQQLMMSLLQ
jgi:hypothetical protein